MPASPRSPRRVSHRSDASHARSVTRFLPHALVLAGMVDLSFACLRPVWRLGDGILGGITDAWMNAFHLWWMRRAFLEQVNPFFTDYLHHPTGTSLLWHTLSPAKSAWGAILLRFTDAVTAYNIVVLCTFVATGFSTWLFLRYVCEKVSSRSWKTEAAAFAGAALFTFSPYLTSHALGHLNLISVEGIPLFLLFYFRFKETRQMRFAVAIGLTSLYVILCDYYSFYYLFLFVGFDVLFTLLSRGVNPLSFRIFRNPALRPAFAAVAVMVTAASPLLVPLLQTYMEGELLNPHHGDGDFYADALGLFVPHRLSFWLPFFPERLENTVMSFAGNAEENGFFLGWLTLLLSSFSVLQRLPFARWFAFLGATGAVLSLGPRLVIAGSTEHRVWIAALILAVLLAFFGRPRTRVMARTGVCALLLIAFVDFLRPFAVQGQDVTFEIPLPYLVFKNIFPLYGVGGMPVRFILFAYLGIAACFALSATFLTKGRRAASGIGILCAFTVIPLTEYFNQPLGIVPFAPRPAVMEEVLRNDSGVAVLTDDSFLSQLEILLHELPVDTARLSRLSSEQKKAHDRVRTFVASWRSDAPPPKGQTMEVLRSAGFKYFVTRTFNEREDRYLREVLDAELLEESHGIRVYRLYE